MAERPTTAPRVRHATAKSTGATTLARRAATDDGWEVSCLSHGATTTIAARADAWKAASHPQDFCPKCAAIVAGKAERMTGERVAIPEPKPAKPAPKPRTPKAASKPAAA